MADLSLRISTEFSRTPGPRKREEGADSGEELLDRLLRDRFTEAVRTNSLLVIDLDGTAGYATSFLEAAFGELAREFEIPVVLKHLRFTSEEEPYLVDEILKYIKEARIPSARWSATG